jgi:hypothetical protein
MKNNNKLKWLIFPIAMLCFATMAKAQYFKSDKSLVTFFSKSPLEDIEAKNTNIVAIMNQKTSDLQIQVVIKGFVFKSALMQEHFNENYMESDKYPVSTFKGKINEPVDYSKDGITKVTTSGKMDMHGVSKEITISGTITVKGGNVTLDARFPVKLEDYNIKVPSLYVKNIAEVIDVTINTNLLPFKKQ